MFYIKKEEFIWELSRYGHISNIYKSICYLNKKYSDEDSGNVNVSKVRYVTLFPTFLTSTIANEENYQLKKINHQNLYGAGIITGNHETIESFLKKNLKTKIRRESNRTIKRLEGCFNISYAYYHGSITKEAFKLLMNTLKNMLEKRFDQKNMVNHFLVNWKTNTHDLFNLIHQKKASLVVIYDGPKPINISINRHYFENKMMFSESNGYDLDYSKFGFGHLNIYLLVKWCIENNYDFLDLGNGVLEYKKKWCDAYYDFEHHIYYKKKSILAYLIASIAIQKIKLKNLLKKHNVDVYIKTLINNIKSFKSNTPGETLLSYTLTVLEPGKTYPENKLKEINIYLPETESVRQPIYDYLYLNQLHIDSISIFKVIEEPNTYLVKTPKERITIDLN